MNFLVRWFVIFMSILLAQTVAAQVFAPAPLPFQEWLEDSAQPGQQGLSMEIDKVTQVMQHHFKGLSVYDAAGTRILLTKTPQIYKDQALLGVAYNEIHKDCEKYALLSLSMPGKFKFKVEYQQSADAEGTIALGNIYSCSLELKQ